MGIGKRKGLLLGMGVLLALLIAVLAFYGIVMPWRIGRYLMPVSLGVAIGTLFYSAWDRRRRRLRG